MQHSSESVPFEFDTSSRGVNQHSHMKVPSNSTTMPPSSPTAEPSPTKLPSVVPSTTTPSTPPSAIPFQSPVSKPTNSSVNSPSSSAISTNRPKRSTKPITHLTYDGSKKSYTGKSYNVHLAKTSSASPAAQLAYFCYIGDILINKAKAVKDPDTLSYDEAMQDADSHHWIDSAILEVDELTEHGTWIEVPITSVPSPESPTRMQKNRKRASSSTNSPIQNKKKNKTSHHTSKVGVSNKKSRYNTGTSNKHSKKKSTSDIINDSFSLPSASNTSTTGASIGPIGIRYQRFR